MSTHIPGFCTDFFADKLYFPNIAYAKKNAHKR